MFTDKFKMFVVILLLAAFLSYSFILYDSAPFTTNRHDALSDEGKLLWQQYNCNACHQIYGLGGYLGPDLTNEYSLRGKEVIKAFLKSGTTTMPDFHLSEKEINALTSFLHYTDMTGSADPRTFILHKNGTIEQPQPFR